MIVGFLNNEARYLEPILTVFEHGNRPPTLDVDASNGLEIAWEERYILLLWMSHLMLAPFDLASISSLVADDELPKDHNLVLPENLPSIPLRVLPICTTSLRAPTRERAASATLLVRMCLRPDMRRAGLLDAIVHWSVLQARNLSHNAIDIHQSLGLLTFLSKLVSSGNHEEIGNHVAAIFHLWGSINESQDTATIRSSAVARKLNVKIIRCIVLLCLQGPIPGLDTTSTLEEAVGYLLETLGDGDSPVRLAASKAISIITLQLDSKMAAEVIDAVLGSLTEDVLWTGSTRNLNAVNPLRWHGLSLTLGHLLYRRAISTHKLPELLNTLLLALNFEQRSATGSSIGTNVRDAANFGIWALSRRYTTAELLAVDITSVQAIQSTGSQLSILQVVAIQLIESACLDPAGNIRRGSSAALQELIGRHPDTVSHGIPLVQAVDYQAVGLRERAMIDIAISAAKFDQIYWESIFNAILGWRGIGAVDSQSRIIAAKSVGLLSSTQSISRAKEMAVAIDNQLHSLASRQVEERQGLLVALASIINTSLLRCGSLLRDNEVIDLSFLLDIWHSLFGLELTENDLTAIAMRPELTAMAVCELLEALSRLTKNLLDAGKHTTSQRECHEAGRLLELCLQRPEETVSEKAANLVNYWIRLVSVEERAAIVHSWIKTLTSNSRTSYKKTGYPAALGAAFGNLIGDHLLQVQIVNTLCDRCSDLIDVEARVVALKSVRRVCEALISMNQAMATKNTFAMPIWQAVGSGLSDYTINERGDVGSLVRLEALNTVELIWSEWDTLGPLFQPDDGNLSNDPVTLSVIRLALEKLDKVRNRAAKCLRAGHGRVPFPHPVPHIDRKPIPYYQQESLYEYYFSGFSLLYYKVERHLCQAVMLGFISSAGMGSESVLQASRAAILDNLADAPAHGVRGKLCIYDFVALLATVLKENLADDRIILPFLDLLAFLLDMQIPQRLTRELPLEHSFK